MNVLSLSDEDDFGGQGIRLKQAFDREPGWTFRSVTGSTSYLGYPPDAGWSEARALYDWADVIHSHNGTRPAWKIDPTLSKPMVIHHHGIYFRTTPHKYISEEQGYLILVSTVDLLLPAPERLTWLPSPHDLGYLSIFRRPTDKIRVGHAPTSRKRKHTAAFLAAMESLSERYPVEMVLIEGRSWAECLALKGTCDIFVDQLLYGYGNNAIEAWGMGIPVVAGTIADERIEPLMVEMFGCIPFLPADERTLEDAIEMLIRDEAMRTEYASRGLAHARRWHESSAVVRRLKDIYRRA